MNIYLQIALWMTHLISLYFSIFWLLIFLDNRKEIHKKQKHFNIPKFPFVSVIIPVFNGANIIKRTIDSVFALEYPKNRLELIVVNDGSKDGTKEVIEEIKKHHKGIPMHIIHQSNQGKAKALNKGMKIAKGEFFSCLDADSMVARKTLKKMIHLYHKEKDPDLAIVTPAMKVSNPSSIIQHLQKLEYIVTLFITRLMSNLDCLYVAPGPFSLYRKKIIQEMGGFDHKSLTEDQEIAYRTQKQQYKIKHCPGANVYTIAPSSKREFYAQRNRWYKGGLSNFFKYRSLAWNKKYGDFGFVQMSNNILMFFLCVGTLFFGYYYMVRPVIRTIKDLILVNFDVIPYLKWPPDINFNLLSLDFEKILIFGFLFMVSLTFIYLAYKYADERLKKRHLIILVPYFFVYYLGLSSIAVIIIIEKLLGREQRW